MSNRRSPAGVGQELEKVSEVLKCAGHGSASVLASWSAPAHLTQTRTARHSGAAKKSDRG
jgi:hypothetical protein